MMSSQSRSHKLCKLKNRHKLPHIFTLNTDIGTVLNLRFSLSIIWNPPPTAGVLSGLTYHLTVTNMNTGVVIINTTTTDTSYVLSSLQPCTLYTASITPISQVYTGGDMVIVRAPGGKKTLEMKFNLQCFVFKITTGWLVCHKWWLPSTMLTHQ